MMMAYPWEYGAQLSIEYDPKPTHNAGNYLSAEKGVNELSEGIMEIYAKKDFSLIGAPKNARTLLKVKKASN